MSLDNVNFYILGAPITADSISLQMKSIESFGTGANSSNPILAVDHHMQWLYLRSHVITVTGGTSPKYSVVACVAGKYSRYR